MTELNEILKKVRGLELGPIKSKHIGFVLAIPVFIGAYVLVDSIFRGGLPTENICLSYIVPMTVYMLIALAPIGVMWFFGQTAAKKLIPWGMGLVLVSGIVIGAWYGDTLYNAYPDGVVEYDDTENLVQLYTTPFIIDKEDSVFCHAIYTGSDPQNASVVVSYMEGENLYEEALTGNITANGTVFSGELDGFSNNIYSISFTLKEGNTSSEVSGMHEALIAGYSSGTVIFHYILYWTGGLFGDIGIPYLIAVLVYWWFRTGKRVREDYAMFDDVDDDEANPDDSSIVRCPECRKALPEMGEYCPHCGAKLKTDLVAQKKTTGDFECTECGATVSEDDDVCPNCGEPFEDDDEENEGSGPEKVFPEEKKEEKNEGDFECTECGATVPEDADVCPNCGEPFDDDADDESGEFMCECGASVSEDADVCPNCGEKFD